jgi:hypothetical protein
MVRGKADSTGCCKSSGRGDDAQINDRLRARAETAAVSLHPHPEALSHNPQLWNALCGLYGQEGADFADATLEHFLSESADSLRVIFRRHGEVALARCLDEYEGVLVLERLQNDRAHLVEVWPFSEQELQEVADAAGVRLTLP